MAYSIIVSKLSVQLLFPLPIYSKGLPLIALGLLRTCSLMKSSKCICYCVGASSSGSSCNIDALLTRLPHSRQLLLRYRLRPRCSRYLGASHVKVRSLHRSIGRKDLGYEVELKASQATRDGGSCMGESIHLLGNSQEQDKGGEEQGMVIKWNA